MINYSIVTDNGDSIYYKTIKAPLTTLTAQKLVDSVIKTILDITSGNTTQITAIATDTCPQMLALHNIIYTIPETKHMFTVLCNSHSL
jgi:hypothetical protein